jgi:hypothetical protein
VTPFSYLCSVCHFIFKFRLASSDDVSLSTLSWLVLVFVMLFFSSVAFHSISASTHVVFLSVKMCHSVFGATVFVKEMSGEKNFCLACKLANIC